MILIHSLRENGVVYVRNGLHTALSARQSVDNEIIYMETNK